MKAVAAADGSDLLTLIEAAAYLRIAQRTAYHWVKEGRFPVPVIRMGSMWRVSRRELEAYAANGGAT